MNKKYLFLFFLLIIFFISALGGSYLAFSYIEDNKKQTQNNDTFDTEVDKNEEGDVVVEYNIVDTGQTVCSNNTSEITCPQLVSDFYGQDAQYFGNEPSYTDNGDGTITDNVTGLMWQKDPGDKVDYYEGINNADNYTLAGHYDWRVPTIKELYSLIDFSGNDPDPTSTSMAGLIPFINDSVFDFSYGDTSAGDRIIDSQWITSSIYQSTVMNNQECFFGVNFADGRIKCYPTENERNNGYYLIHVRGENYGQNDYVDNEDGTVSDNATGLMWQKADNGEGIIWSEALGYCEELVLGQKDDWRLPNAKELHSIVDYSRSPDTTNSAAINPIFGVSSITNERNEADYPFYWSSTTHIRYPNSYSDAAYVSFGRALGFMNGQWMDVHGAGAQRSDPKEGNPEDFPQGLGPQGDTRRIYNYVRCVRDL